MVQSYYIPSDARRDVPQISAFRQGIGLHLVTSGDHGLKKPKVTLQQDRVKQFNVSCSSQNLMSK